MLHTHRIYLSVAALLFASLACASVPVFSAPDTGAISTSAAQTVIAGLTQNAPQATLSATLRQLQHLHSRLSRQRLRQQKHLPPHKHSRNTGFYSHAACSIDQRFSADQLSQRTGQSL